MVPMTNGMGSMPRVIQAQENPEFICKARYSITTQCAKKIHLSLKYYIDF
jgi:hypothetical protein